MRLRRVGAFLTALVTSVALLQVPPDPRPAAATTVDQEKPTPDVAVTEEQASAQARRSGERVEVVSKRGEHQDVWALPGGGFELVEHLRPVRVRKNGAWVKVDTTLKRSGDAVVPTATSVDLELSAGGSGPLVAMSRGGRTLSLTWPHKLPEPVLEGDTAVYRGVLGPDVDLHVRVDADGFSHTLEVKTAEAAKDPRLAKIAYGLETSGLTVSKDASGVMRATAPGVGDMFKAPAPTMWDSSSPDASRGKTAKRPAPKAPSADGPGDASTVAPIRVGVGSGRLTLEPDRTLLSSPDTKFPVFIDPVWGAEKSYAWAMVSSGYPGQSYYKFTGTEGLGFCDVSWDSRCVKDQTKRLFYRFKLPSLAGKYVESTEFVAYETDAYDCNNDTVVRLYRTSALSSSPTWDNTAGNWGDLLASRDVAYCSRTPVEFGGATLRSHVQDALDKKYSTITFGLRAYDETSMAWWKRFAEDAHLKIQYNNPPKQPNTDSMYSSPGTKCVDKPQAGWVNQRPKLYAYLHDPDTEDANKVQGQFQVSWANNADGSDWGPKWTAPLTAAKTSGSRFTVDLEALNAPLPTKKIMDWHVRAWDGVQWGPWSYAGAQTGCYFYYDPAVPAAPTVSSTDYPSDESWHGGVGEAGTFTISDSAGAAARYDVSLNGVPVASVNTTNGAAQNVPVAPTKSGPNLLTVQAFTNASQNSAPKTVEFLVKAGAEATARFTLDEDPGTTSVAATSPGTPAYVRGAATLGGTGQIGSALTLAGGYAEAGLPAVRTDQSFTVSTWVKPSQTGMRNVLAQDGAHQSGFQLGIQPDGKPVFKMPSTDTAGDGGGAWRSALGGTALTLDTWVHLTGVYDQPAQQIRLYVNGTQAATVSQVTAWRANGGLQIGRSKYNDGYANPWQGGVDDIRIYPRALSGANVQELAGGQDPSGGAASAHWTLNEDEGSVRVHSPAATVTAALTGGATLGQPGQDGTALRLDGTGYADTAGPVVNPVRSYAVAAWVKPASGGANYQTVVAQEGVNMGTFRIERAGPVNKWKMTGLNTDSSTGGYSSAISTRDVVVGEWTHLAGVYDSTRHQLSLYVNGEHQQTVSYDAAGWSNAQLGALMIGRWRGSGNIVDRFNGDIDDVRVFDRIIGPGEVKELVTQHPVLKGRWKLNTDGSGEPSGTQALTLNGGATIDGAAGFAWVSPGGLQLNGTTAYAATATPPVSTQRSFSVTGWVRNSGRPQSAVTVFSQAGANANVFALRYVPDATDPANVGGWTLETHNADQTADPPVQVSHSTFTEWDWDHVAIVYDALLDEMSLYVDGALEETSLNVSKGGQVLGFDTTNGGLQVGRSKLGGTGGSQFWPDAIDDVWVYQGALTKEQVQMLAARVELETQYGP